MEHTHGDQIDPARDFRGTDPLADDRETQLELYSDDCVWEFPYAGDDRPKRIVGRDEIARVMAPLWERARRANFPPASYTPLMIHHTTDPEVIVSEFIFASETAQMTFVQVMRVRDGRIVHLREYADSRRRHS